MGLGLLLYLYVCAERSYLEISLHLIDLRYIYMCDVSYVTLR